MNDLIGLEYKWGANPDADKGYCDCFQLFCAVRRRLQMQDYVSQFAWVYGQYDEASFSWRIMKTWLKENCSLITDPGDGDVGIFAKRPALASVAHGRIYCIAPRGRSVSMMSSKDALSSIHWFRPQ
jgi:hypothetical protein